MGLKETPLRKALARTGPIRLPGNSFLNGILSVYLCAFFNAIAMLFWVITFSQGFPLEIFGAVLGGVIIALMFTFLIHCAVFLIAVFGSTAERQHRLLYVSGSLSGI